MKKIKLSILLLISFFITHQISIGYYFGEQTDLEKKVTQGFDTRCKDIKETDYPTIFIPGILASWYSEYGFEDSKIKRWIPDPITHVYDTLFYTFRQNGYTLEDVFYKDEFNVYIEGNPKGALYLFGYDWKKDNTVTATLLTQLIGKILDEYEKQNGCDIGKVNVIAHSMGGLVARSLLEDMCVEYKNNSGTFSILNFYEYDEEGNIESLQGIMRKLDIKPCINPINLDKPIKVHKLITIATPHRGSPKTFPIWEKGDINMTDGFIMGQVLKLQFFNVTNQGFYETIHGYNQNVPNGAVSVGQLLPDISKPNSYNSKLEYLTKKNKIIPLSSYPKNSFLESLNSQENIDKIWDKVDSYISYYSTITGDKGNNNIIGFNLPEKILVGIDETIDGPDKGIYVDELTEDIFGRDIYEKYTDWFDRELYNMSTVKRNNSGLGGDGTVPTYNLRLVPNDSQNGKEVNNSKFESKEIRCFQDISYLYKDGNESREYRGFGDKDMYEVCSHSNMPIATAVKVYEDISGKKKEGNMREVLMGYIGSADYTLGSLYPLIYGIENKTVMQSIFGVYKRIIQSENISKTDRFSIDVSGGYFSQTNSVIAYEVLSPINLLITDSQGRRIGIDPDTGHIVNEIPGAWTSGDTEGSNEPEFFLIPVGDEEILRHNVKTFSTGDGVYHIEARMIDLTPNPSPVRRGEGDGGVGVRSNTDNDITQLFTIAGNAKQGFGEEYRVERSNNDDSETSSEGQSDDSEIQPDRQSEGHSFAKASECMANDTNCSVGKYTYTTISNYPAMIDIENTEYITSEQDFTLRYMIRGNHENVGKLQMTLTPAKGIATKKVLDINGKIELPLPEFGEYKLKLQLLDAHGKLLTHDGASREIKITRQENILQKQLRLDTIQGKNGGVPDEQTLKLQEEISRDKWYIDLLPFFTK